jgi:hypothetical protein
MFVSGEIVWRSKSEMYLGQETEDIHQGSHHQEISTAHLQLRCTSSAAVIPESIVSHPKKRIAVIRHPLCTFADLANQAFSFRHCRRLAILAHASNLV